MNEKLLKDFNEQRERLYNEIEELEKERDKWKDKYWELEEEIAENKIEQKNIKLQTRICKAIEFMNKNYNPGVESQFYWLEKILKGENYE